jgi:hypothetical protein
MSDQATPAVLRLNAGLGPLLPERAEFERWVDTERPSMRSAVRTYDESMALAHVMDGAWLAWQAGRAAERRRFADACNAYAVRLRAMPAAELPTPVEVANDLRDLALGPNEY